MIDYEKLKEAINLCTKFSRNNQVANITLSLTDGELTYWFYDSKTQDESEYDSLDELIEKLQELTKSEPKYKVGQKWWALGSLGKPFEVEIVGIMGGDLDLVFPDGSCRYGCVKELFPTRQALIEHQIKYWRSISEVQPGSSGVSTPITWDFSAKSNQSQVDVDGCQHSTNGNIYIIDGFNGSKESFKCIKCGEFYK